MLENNKNKNVQRNLYGCKEDKIKYNSVSHDKLGADPANMGSTGS